MIISAETRQKISKTLKKRYSEGLTNPFLGKKHTLESRAKMSRSLKGRAGWSKGIKRWIDKPNPFKGRHHSEETKKRWRIIRKGICYSPKTAFRKGDLRITGTANPNWKGGVVINKEYVLAKNREWNEKNREKRRHFGKLRRAMERGALGSHTFAQWEILKAQYNWTCPACEKKEPEIKLTEDHIIPLKKGGSNNIENIQPLCGNCNSKKHTVIVQYQIKN